MRRMVPIVVALALIGAGIWVWFGTSGPSIVAEDVRAMPVPGAPNAVMVTMALANASDVPDRLTGVRADQAKMAMLKSPDTTGLPVPAGTRPELAMERGHIMLMGLPDAPAEGTLIPLTLIFERSGEMAVKARVTAPMMDHAMGYEVPEGTPAPGVAIAVAPDGDGWRVTLTTRNFRFAEDLVDKPHQPGTGHAHLYVQGIKIGRVFGTEARIGALPSGSHLVEVTLNTNDHRVYHVDGQPIRAEARITVD